MNLRLILFIPVYAVTISSTTSFVLRTDDISDKLNQNFLEDKNHDSFNLRRLEHRQKRQLNLFGSDSNWSQVLTRVFAEIVKQVRNALQNSGSGDSNFSSVFRLLSRLMNDDANSNDSSSSQDFVGGLRKLASDAISQYLKRFALNT